MRIAQVVSLFESVPPKSQNGLEFMVSWLTEELVNRGHDVTLFAPADSITNANLFSIIPTGISHLKIHGLDVGFYSAWNTISSAINGDFDLIHCHNMAAPYIAPFAKCPVIQTFHHTSGDLVKKDIENDPRIEDFLNGVYEQFSKIHYVSVSKRQEDLFIDYEGHYITKHSVIYNGIPIEKFSFNDSPKDYLFYIGYINKNKGADVAVQIAKKLGMKLILAGNNYGEEKFFEEHIKPFLNDKISYVGPVDFETKNELYRNAFATLAPIHWEEPFGLTIVESQACGTPVIGFNKGAMSEIIDDGKTGFVVETEQEMIDAVKKITTIDRKKCREWVEKNFSVKKMVDQYEKLYKKLI